MEFGFPSINPYSLFTEYVICYCTEYYVYTLLQPACVQLSLFQTISVLHSKYRAGLLILT